MKRLRTRSCLPVSCSSVMSTGWSHEETRALLGVWGASDVQQQLDGVVRNKSIYQKIATALRDVGYERSWEQCKTKIKNMVQKYKKVKDSNDVSGTDRKTCPFYDELNAILGTRAASSPPVLIDSGGMSHSSTTSINEEDTAGKEIPYLTEESSSNVEDGTGLSNSTTAIADGEVPPTTSTNTSSSGNSSNSTTSSSRREQLTARKRGLKRKHVSENDAVLESLMKVFERAEERASEREERMRKMELEMEEKMREREERREMQMLSMFSSVMQQMCGGGSRPVHSPSFFQPRYPYQPPSQQPHPSVQLPPTTPSQQNPSLQNSSHFDFPDYDPQSPA